MKLSYDVGGFFGLGITLYWKTPRKRYVRKTWNLYLHLLFIRIVLTGAKYGSHEQAPIVADSPIAGPDA